MANVQLSKAKNGKNDEFYTQLPDIEKELRHYKEHFLGKIVFCNCDDPYESNFFKYFALNFNHLGLKKLICTCYDSSPVAGEQLALFPERNPYKIEISEVVDENRDGAVDLSDVEYLLKNKKNVLKRLKSGDFRSEECVELLKESDIVVTNPPFSLFREYVAQLIEYDKKFIIIGSKNAITYKEIFPLLKDNKMWLGYGFANGNAYFKVSNPDKDYANGVYDSDTGLVKFRNCAWYTNLDTTKRHEELILYKRFSEENYPFYVNYDAINVDKYMDIPCDYDGEMGVPITFLDKYNPEQFEIVSLGIVGSIKFKHERKMEILDKAGNPTGKYTVNAKGTLYRRYNPEIDKKPPAFKDSETGELYSSIYARVIIKKRG